MSDDRAVSVSIVLVATDERPFLVAALDSLFASAPDLAFEVVVVDNASSDGTAEEVADRWPGVRVLRQDRRQGLSANMNLGMRGSVGPFVMMCNSDIVFRAGAIDCLAEFLASHPQAAMAAPRLLSPEGEVWPVARRWYTWRVLALRRLPGRRRNAQLRPVQRHLYEDWDGIEPRRVDWVLCAATLVRRSALEAIGLMDERFRIYFTDVDLALRAHEGGWEVWAVPEAEVVHHWRRASRRPLSAAWFSHLHSLVVFVAKHRGLRPRRRLPITAPTTAGAE